jgi:DNA transformation protein
MSQPRPLSELRNIGPTIAARLREVGIETEDDLARVGPLEAWRRVVEAQPGKTIPVCYYLYSLQGALLDLHWNNLPDEVKRELDEGVATTRAAMT